ncbi:MAG: hypothetical protein HY340_03155 [Candidatus Kerfeldbacteria bacterium]|nr:hypothetical protein [Candidatus Kerfeldbacteria bacterium]
MSKTKAIIFTALVAILAIGGILTVALTAQPKPAQALNPTTWGCIKACMEQGGGEACQRMCTK